MGIPFKSEYTTSRISPRGGVTVQEPENDTPSDNQAEASTGMDPSAPVYIPTATQSDPPSLPLDPYNTTVPFFETSPHWLAIAFYHTEGS